MSLKDETLRHLKLLGARAEAIADAYTSGRGLLDEHSVDPKLVDELVQRRVANRSSLDGLARLSGHLVSHLDVAMSTARIRQSGLDIGTLVDSIRDATGAYMKLKVINQDDAQVYLDTAESTAHALADSLLEEAADVWGLIQGEFSIVESLEAKILLNRDRLERTGRLISALESLKLSEIMELGQADNRLRSLFMSRIPAAIEGSRQNLSDALSQLKKMLFRFEQIEARTGLVKAYRRHLQRHPDFMPQDYSVQLAVPGLFMAVEPHKVLAYADVKTSDSRMENQLAELLAGLRAEQPAKRPGEYTDGTLQEGDAEEVEVKPSPVRDAIRRLFAEALASDSPLSVLCHVDQALSANAELWLLTTLEEFNSMPTEHRDVFHLEYVGRPDVIFDGNFNATDLLICPR